MKATIRLLITSLTLLSASPAAFSQIIIVPTTPTTPTVPTIPTVPIIPGTPTTPSVPSEDLPTRPVSDDPIPDINFVQQAGESLIFEVLAGNLAITHSNSPAVRKFARRLIRDNSRDYSKLSAAAIKSGLQVPTGPNNDQKDELKKLTKLFGPAFNQEFLRSVIQQNIADSPIYVNEVRNGVLVPVRNYARQHLPVLSLQLQLAFIAAIQSGVVFTGK